MSLTILCQFQPGVAYKKCWLRKKACIRFISSFMTPQPGSQTIAIHISQNILQNKGKQAMKLVQLVAKNKSGRLVSGFFWFFEKLCIR